MSDPLDVETCVQYWQAARDTGDSNLEHKCLNLCLKEFVGMSATCHLHHITNDIMKAATMNKMTSMSAIKRNCVTYY